METGQVILYSFIAVLFLAVMIYLIYFDKEDDDFTSLWLMIDENKIKSTDILEKQIDREMKKALDVDIILLTEDEINKGWMQTEEQMNARAEMIAKKF